jgi:hypothetical protein
MNTTRVKHITNVFVLLFGLAAILPVLPVAIALMVHLDMSDRSVLKLMEFAFAANGAWAILMFGLLYAEDSYQPVLKIFGMIFGVIQMAMYTKPPSEYVTGVSMLLPVVGIAMVMIFFFTRKNYR